MQNILHFLGRGSAFNPSMENTSAWFPNGNDFVLIDCGETVFSHLWNKKEFIQADRILVLITHLHSDHVGSLGTLISYCSLVIHKKVELCYPTKMLPAYLSMIGIDSGLYQCYERVPESWGFSASAFPVDHAEDMDCFGYVVQAKGDSFYYSGDANDIPDKVLDEFLKGNISFLFHDTSSIQSEHHCWYGTLEKKIPKDKRKNLYCMHLQDAQCISDLKQLGFSIAEVSND